MQLLQFKALADSTRLRLVHLLLRYEFSVNELVQILGMGQSRISRHLKILTEAGLLSSRRDGLWIFYTVPREGHCHDFLAAIAPFWVVTEEMRADGLRALHVLDERNARSRHFFDAIAEKWDDLNREILGDVDLQEAICESVPDNCKTAADLGCGTGSVLTALVQRVPMVIGVDNSQRMLEFCAKRFQNADQVSGRLSLRIGELTHLPFRDRELDFACINLVLHHLSDPVAALRETRRCLEPGGILFLSDFAQHNDEMMRERYGDLRLGFSREELCIWLERTGFKLERMTALGVQRNLSLLLLCARACDES
ncbi:MAG: metalloregulator ArsR/SmtB family transcription factor [Desulfovibrio sp.]|nr:metalloregulator ArsR/SmtB family transcription factor [Desulfovibrio sp.]